MHSTWPLGHIPSHLQRPELSLLKEAGYSINDPYDAVTLFEDMVAKFAGAKYGVAVDSCSNGLFLSLKYMQATGNVFVPKHTYVSVPMQVRHAGCTPVFQDIDWVGKYQLEPYDIWDAAIQWREGMYDSGLQVLSFQIKKRIPIGRGGMILTDDADAAHWLRMAVHDGRSMKIPYAIDKPLMDGWHYYMTPEDAARGILLMNALPGNIPDRRGKDLCMDITKHVHTLNNL